MDNTTDSSSRGNLMDTPETSMTSPPHPATARMPLEDYVIGEIVRSEPSSKAEMWNRILTYEDRNGISPKEPKERQKHIEKTWHIAGAIVEACKAIREMYDIRVG
jgi:hypothetical protein